VYVKLLTLYQIIGIIANRLPLLSSRPAVILL